MSNQSALDQEAIEIYKKELALMSTYATLLLRRLSNLEQLGGPDRDLQRQLDNKIAEATKHMLQELVNNL